MMTKWRWSLLLVLCGLATQASAQHGRFLPNPAGSIVFSYGNANPTAFDQNVLCQALPIGSIKFDYDTYLKKPTGTTDGGGALSGGFYLNPLFDVSSDCELIWVQTVTATLSGNNDWGITVGNTEFPDATRTNPAYPFATAAVNPPAPLGAPYLGFQDAPNRFFSDGNQSWIAELGLVAIHKTPVAGVIQAHVIDTFLWGFGVTTAPNAITPTAPNNFGAPTASYLTILNDYYDGAPPNPPTDGGTSAKYNFVSGCDTGCFTPHIAPEPSSVGLLVMGLSAGGFVVGFGRRPRVRGRVRPERPTTLA